MGWSHEPQGEAGGLSGTKIPSLLIPSSPLSQMVMAFAWESKASLSALEDRRQVGCEGVAWNHPQASAASPWIKDSKESGE